MLDVRKNNVGRHAIDANPLHFLRELPIAMAGCARLSIRQNIQVLRVVASAAFYISVHVIGMGEV